MALTRNMVPRALLAAFLLSMFLFPRRTFEHFEAHINGSIMGTMIEGNWALVALNVVAFMLFLVPLSFRRKVDWKGFGLVGAFFVSLFVEMYGLPLTILLASKYFGGGEEAHLDYAMTFDIGGVGFGLTLPMVYAMVLISAGTTIVIVAWTTLYRGVRKDVLVTTGIYSFSRHPQYLGFIMVVTGWVIGWPTILTIVFGPILVGWYVRTCIIEEKEMARVAPYEDYRERTPFLI